MVIKCRWDFLIKKKKKVLLLFWGVDAALGKIFNALCMIIPAVWYYVLIFFLFWRPCHFQGHRRLIIRMVFDINFCFGCEL